MPTIGRNILEAKHPPVRMIWINGSNVINQAPGIHETLRAFESIDFKVVVDAFMTDTGERAHLFLPCSLMFEQEDIGVSYLHDFVHHAPKVFSAPGEARSDHWILSELGKRLEPPIRLPGPEACLRASLNLPRLSISLEELREKHFVEAEHPPVAYAGMQFDHPDGKYHLPTQLHEEPPPPAGYPLRLLTLIRRESIHSQILPEDQTATPTVWVAPDCLCLGRPGPVKDVYLVSPLGRLKVRVEVSPGLHPGVAICRRGDWMKLGGGVNQLIAAGLTDIGNGAPYYQQYVSLEYATDQQLEELFDSMANSPQSVQAEIGSFCEGCAHRLDELNSDEARVELISEELPKLLLNKDLMAGLLSNITNGEAYPDVRRPTMFDNEVLLYLDPRGLFSLRIYLWGPMEYTYPHDHNSWGVIGAASEGYEVVNYRRVDDESHEGYARLVEVERLRLQPGETAFTLPFSKGIHKTGNATQASIATLHFYGKTLPRGHLNGFDIANNRVYRIYPPKQKKRLLAQQALECLGKAL
jgi:predicted metal-dependent enzyme (double-stranded beta helix superfamily)